ncbi:hypothetical protein GCM10020220_000080 [Nonomuraea rubra]|uniref:hypothetical protein n=1 Tax=Nonomuraea rubra TaxID=46180 RepID=UPI0031E77A14
MCANPFFSGLTHHSWNGTGYLLTQPYTDETATSYPDQDWVYEPSAHRIQEPREYRQTLSRMTNSLIQEGFVLTFLSEVRGDYPGAEPGSWAHFTGVAPPWLESRLAVPARRPLNAAPRRPLESPRFPSDGPPPARLNWRALEPAHPMDAHTRTQTVADRLAVVANPACPPEILIILVDDPHWSVRWSLPDHPATGVEVRRAICRSADDVLRRLLAESGGLDAETNAALAADRSPDVRAGLAAPHRRPAPPRHPADRPRPRGPRPRRREPPRRPPPPRPRQVGRRADGRGAVGRAPSRRVATPRP